VTLTGHVPFDAVGRHFDGAAAFVNTSEYEGLPNTFVQAWLRGVPTLSFVRPESAPGESGTLACDSMDGAHGLAARLQQLLTQREAWQQASQGCHAHFLRHHTLQAAVQAHLALFETVLARHRRVQPGTAPGPARGAVR
jgi:glycosyltransferase involved in cell wall biosynthesis